MKKHIRERQQFIKDTLDKTGKLNRKDIANEFEVSDITAAIDIRTFLTNNPNYAEYCQSEKTYKKVFTNI